MKTLLLSLGLLVAGITRLPAQSRVSIAPTYWFNYNPYSYRVDMAFNGSRSQFLASGHGLISSVGLTARYHFTPKWNVSLGGLYYRSTDHITSPQGPYGELTSSSEGWQLPILVSYRLTDRPLSLYFSSGAILAKSKTFTGAPIKTDGLVGVGLDYRFNSDLSLLVQPTTSYSFTKPVSDAFYQVTDYSSYSLGVQTQLIYHF